jgi:hypothetical protein
MNTPKDTNASDSHQLINEQRRRLAKGGLAAPIVIGTLLSRPVLGAAPHKCTISGQLSGNVSTHGTAILCSSLGLSPATYASTIPTTTTWPSRLKLIKNNGNPRDFADCPFGAAKMFEPAFERYNTNNGNAGAAATVFELLKGAAVDNAGVAVANRGIRVKTTGGFDTINGLELGKEALAAYMNATDQTKYPITQLDVVVMFNSVIKAGGVYNYSSTVSWDASKVLAYFRSLHA